MKTKYAGGITHDSFTGQFAFDDETKHDPKNGQFTGSGGSSGGSGSQKKKEGPVSSGGSVTIAQANILQYLINNKSSKGIDRDRHINNSLRACEEKGFIKSKGSEYIITPEGRAAFAKKLESFK
jgi:hypothetical protein